MRELQRLTDTPRPHQDVGANPEGRCQPVTANGSITDHARSKAPAAHNPRTAACAQNQSSRSRAASTSCSRAPRSTIASTTRGGTPPWLSSCHWRSSRFTAAP
ncbi:hypothetical protein ACFQ1I_00690 [Kitasatospora arboriphila]